MIIYTKDNGFEFVSKASDKHYRLYEGKSYKGNTTSDRILIWDEESDKLVNFVYGANILEVHDIDTACADYVAEYEAEQRTSRRAEIVATYRFTDAGVKAFLDCASADFFEEMEKDYTSQNLGQFDIVVSCGKHSINIPLGAEEWEAVNVMLNECMEVNK